MANEIFIDWLTITQLHPQGGLPVIVGGLVVGYDRDGNARFERASPSRLGGSHSTSLQIRSDGGSVSLSGNVGRFSRQDNVFNLGFGETVSKANRIMLAQGLPAFTPGWVASDGQYQRGAQISRVDITANFATGSESQARALIRWLANRSVSRMKKGRAGDESVWWSNTRHMLKAYIKHIEMLKHGISEDDPSYQLCKRQGVVRVELELKRRLLCDLGLSKLENVTDEKLIKVFHDETEIFKRVDRSDEPDILDSIPSKSRIYASAWLAGQDLRSLASQATLYRHAKILREYGLDILEPRETNVEKFPVKVNVIELRPLSMPDWYNLNDNLTSLKVVNDD